MLIQVIAALAVAIWLYLAFAHGGFWLAAEREDAPPAQPSTWPSVAVVIPARDEVEGIAQSLASLFAQDYPGEWSVILVDDNSSDGTAAVARNAATIANAEARFEVVAGQPLPSGWTGKLWAVKQGVDAAAAKPTPPDYVLLTDADIVYEPGVLAALVARAEAGKFVLTSLMVKLHCESFAERCLIPAFVFFFQKLYPFAWVSRPGGRIAAAAGGCMLVRPGVLREAGGVEAIRGELIDDCALAKLVKTRGPIWLGLTERVHSIRRYPHFGDIRRMVVRSAYAQLGYSPALLAATVVGMVLTYLAPPLIALFGSGSARILGLWGWTLMAVLFVPTLRLYRMSPFWGLALPAIALSYLAFTIESAVQFMQGRGGLWKGRVQAGPSALPSPPTSGPSAPTSAP
jgi:hopene-associated glycosyltransferase HpnB